MHRRHNIKFTWTLCKQKKNNNNNNYVQTSWKHDKIAIWPSKSENCNDDALSECHLCVAHRHMCSSRDFSCDLNHLIDSWGLALFYSLRNILYCVYPVAVAWASIPKILYKIVCVLVVQACECVKFVWSLA